MHINITDSAARYLQKKAAFYNGKNRLPRIVLSSQSCRGAIFRLWHDFPDANDLQLTDQGIEVIVNSDLISKYGGFSIDTEQFFFVTKVLIEPLNDIKECNCDAKRGNECHQNS
ncbi:MAG: hypothetical protein CVU48_10765 [Candidatus Cloacimonetes bacterium HGW-Cloacimonetes-1]|jgi:Fe-S cluster assembly iron-binding protein IscA|nr:MAG: hypothetical protein CVU48_10765 [Candidatus Cloacimonetes bacterium HGW-Cloacimonetes-1]